MSILLSQQSAVQKLVANTGEVFTALSERDGQLSPLITNANQVFQTTANRNAELQQTFIALPTFEHESQLTLRALTAFALNTNPLVTTLRPAARQLSPLLIDTARLAPFLKTFFVQLNPLSYDVDGLRGVLTSGFVFGVATDFAVLGGLAAILLAIGAYLFSKIEV